MSGIRKDTLRLIWLEAFILVAQHESYTAAAVAMACDQSTVTRYIRQLEIWLHRPLVKGTVPTVLTERGQSFVATAKQVVSLLNASRANLAKMPPVLPE